MPRSPRLLRVVFVCFAVAFLLLRACVRVNAGVVCEGFGRITKVQFIEDGRRVVVTNDGLLGAVQAWVTGLPDNWTDANGGYFIHQLDAVEELLWVETTEGKRFIIVYESAGAADIVLPTAFPNMQTNHPCSAGIMPRAAFEAWRLAAQESE